MSNVPIIGDVIKAADEVVARVEGGGLCSTENPGKPDCGARCRCSEKAGHDGGHKCGKGHTWT